MTSRVLIVGFCLIAIGVELILSSTAGASRRAALGLGLMLATRLEIPFEPTPTHERSDALVSSGMRRSQLPHPWRMRQLSSLARAVGPPGLAIFPSLLSAHIAKYY